MKKCLSVALFLTVFATAPAYADPVLFSAVLTGADENPATPSPALGFALVGYDAASQLLNVQAVFAGLTSPNIAAHIHCCVDPPGLAGVATPVPTFPGFPSGTTSGVYDHSLDLTDPLSYNPMFLAAAGGTPLAAELALANGLAMGRAYFNIHTANFDTGEIRGFLTPFEPSAVPEPASLMLVAVGLGACVARRRRLSQQKLRS
jgi:hypothetical protein